MAARKTSSHPSLEKRLATSKTHSNRVRFLRKALPFVIASIILVILLWTSIDIFFEDKIDGLSDVKTNLAFHNRVINPELKTTDAKGTPITVKAQSATHTQDDSASFDKPCCELEGPEGQKATLSADQGDLDQNRKTFIYRGNVVLEAQTKSQGPIILKTNSAKVLLDAQRAESDDELVGHGPMGTLTSKHGFRFDRKTQMLYFKGPSTLTINTPDQAKPRGAS